MPYHAEQCVLDTINHYGATDLYSLYMECSNRCNTPEFAETNMIGDGHNATNRAIHNLAKAGIIDVNKGNYYITDYGFTLMYDSERYIDWLVTIA